MKLMATAKKVVKKVSKKVSKATKKAVAKFSPEWYALKAEARKKLDEK